MNHAINCSQARMHFALLLYGELSFDEEERVETHLDGCAECREELERQKLLHAALDGVAAEPSASLLRECRADLAAALRHSSVPQVREGWWDRLVESLAGGHVLRPAAAAALVLLGFLGARLTPFLSESLAGLDLTGANQAGIARVSDVEAQNDGSVRIVVDETRQKTITGGLDDQRIRSLLLEAVRDPSNPGLRADSVDLLTRRAQSAEIRGALVYLVGHDQNDGVRLKAMEGLKPFVAEPDVRGALSRALLSDANPGVRTQAIDLLIQDPSGDALPNIDRAMIGTLQELMLRERNASVRQRCEKVLEEMNASAEIY
jgi:Putative zinc-finger